jgi:dolichol-phosphate mannosyltransferase
MNVLVIIPTYNEAENIEPLIKKIFDFIPRANVLIIDDNSPDGTGAIVEKIKERDKRVSIIHRERKLGLGSACIQGFEYGMKNNYDLFITMDADFSHDPKDLPNFLEKINEGYDIVIASRYIKDGKIINWGIYRKFTSKSANILKNFVLGLGTHDITTNYRAYKRTAMEKIDLDKITSSGFSFLQDILYLARKKNLKIGEFPSVFVNRRSGKSKFSGGEIQEFVVSLIKTRFKM